MKPVSTAGRAARVDEVDLALELARQQLVGRDLVDLGEAQQPRHRDRPLAPLVGAEHRRLELQVRARLDVVERQALLPADRPEALADPCSGRSPPAQPPRRPGADMSPAPVPMRTLASAHALRCDAVGIVTARSVKVMLRANPTPVHDCTRGNGAPRHTIAGSRQQRGDRGDGAVSARRTWGPTASRGAAPRTARARPGRSRPRGRRRTVQPAGPGRRQRARPRRRRGRRPRGPAPADEVGELADRPRPRAAGPGGTAPRPPGRLVAAASRAAAAAVVVPPHDAAAACAPARCGRRPSSVSRATTVSSPPLVERDRERRPRGTSSGSTRDGPRRARARARRAPTRRTS